MKIDIKRVTEGDFKAFNDIPVTDCHTHVISFEKIAVLEDVWHRYRVDRMNVLSAACAGESLLSDNALCLLFKLRNPRAFAFGSLSYPPYGAPQDGAELVAQAQRLMSLGFDGMKMLEGKPDSRKRIGVPLDAPVFDAYYEYLAENRIPVLYHVADPGVFWDKDNITPEAIQNNWAYLDGSFQPKQGLYREVEGFLRKHPGLRVIFAHFFFMDEEGIARASDFLDRWPYVSFDLTPGMMYQTFSRDTDGWRQFFIKYQDRLLFGTDNDYGESRELLYVLRTFLETENEVGYWGVNLRGIALDRPALEKIYRGNFIRYAGDEPKPVGTEQVRAACEHLLRRAQASPAAGKLQADAGLVLDALKQ